MFPTCRIVRVLQEVFEIPAHVFLILICEFEVEVASCCLTGQPDAFECDFDAVFVFIFSELCEAESIIIVFLLNFLIMSHDFRQLTNNNLPIAERNILSGVFVTGLPLLSEYKSLHSSFTKEKSIT
ncbi:MAG: hypothetical protein K8R25_06305 [Methanosarcinales archaeon]|nr:hypothetical protein [Methanosarcinales archaeon]